MGMELIPKVVIVVNSETLAATWHCPGCGNCNDVYLFNDEIKACRKEAKAIDQVQCDTCTRRFQTQ